MLSHLKVGWNIACCFVTVMSSSTVIVDILLLFCVAFSLFSGKQVTLE